MTPDELQGTLGLFIDLEKGLLEHLAKNLGVSEEDAISPEKQAFDTIRSYFEEARKMTIQSYVTSEIQNALKKGMVTP